MKNNSKWIVILAFLGLVIMSCDDKKDEAGPITDLTVATVSTAPTLDGVGTDDAWNQADELLITVGTTAAHQNEAGIVDVRLTAVRDNQNIYIKAVWDDPTGTMSVDKKQWTYENGLWTQSGNEDRLFFFFDMGQNGSQGADCATMCHEDVEVMYTDNGIVDQWHWKAHRSAPIHHADDKYIDNNYTDANGNVIPEDGGQHGDSKTKGLYHDNNDGNGAPIYSGPITDGHYLILPAGQTADTYFTAFDSTTSTSSPIPGYWLDENADGSRADVTAYSTYSNGTWTVEFSRALNTGNDDDVVFGSGDVQTTVAITDNSGHEHSGAAPFYLKF